MSHIFLSYAHEDADAALKLYKEISANGYPVWLDQKALLPGQRWKDEVARAILDSAGFIALISEKSVDKRGHVQDELRQGLDVFAKVPVNQIYLIPVRLQDVKPVERVLVEDLHWVDLFKDWKDGTRRLLEAIATIPGLPATSPEDEPSSEAKERPRKFASMSDLFRLILESMPPSTPETGAVNAFYLTVRTTAEGVELPTNLRERYPEEIVFVLQHQYANMTCDDSGFCVTLFFSGKEERIRIPYHSIMELTEPSANIRIA